MKRQKNSFLTPLVLESLPSGKRFRLYNEFTYLWKREYIEIHVRRGFETDLASIPRVFRWLITKLGRQNKAAVIHDALYQNEYTTPNNCPRHEFTRAEADLVFLDGNRDAGVKKWKRRLIYLAVRTGGWASWQKRPAGWRKRK